MSNALRFMQCLPFGRQSKLYQSPRSDRHNGSRLMSLFTAVSVILGSLLGISAGVVAEENAVIEEVVVTGSRIRRRYPYLVTLDEHKKYRARTALRLFWNELQSPDRW